MIGAVMLMIVYYIDNNCKPENGEPVVGIISIWPQSLFKLITEKQRSRKQKAKKRKNESVSRINLI